MYAVTAAEERALRELLVEVLGSQRLQWGSHHSRMTDICELPEFEEGFAMRGWTHPRKPPCQRTIKKFIDGGEERNVKKETLQPLVVWATYKHRKSFLRLVEKYTAILGSDPIRTTSRYLRSSDIREHYDKENGKSFQFLSEYVFVYPYFEQPKDELILCTLLVDEFENEYTATLKSEYTRRDLNRRTTLSLSGPISIIGSRGILWLHDKSERSELSTILGIIEHVTFGFHGEIEAFRGVCVNSLGSNPISAWPFCARTRSAALSTTDNPVTIKSIEKYFGADELRQFARGAVYWKEQDFPQTGFVNAVKARSVSNA